ncbi:MAG: LysR substrate-binding domain-containing protein, partial [Pseudomonadota bacterium]
EGPMADIRDASERIRSSAVRHRVTLTLTPSFAAGWFLPRMRRLTEALPELELNLVSTTRVIDLAIENVDLAIRRGAGTWPGLERAPMFTETIVPVVAHASVANGAAGSLYHLLRDKGLLVNATLPGEWDDWAALNGIELGPDLRRFTLETYELTIEACRDGLGVALGRRPLVDPLLASDTLVQPFTETSTPSLGYFIVWRTERPPSAMARRLKDWLLAECSAK